MNYYQLLAELDRIRPKVKGLGPSIAKLLNTDKNTYANILSGKIKDVGVINDFLSAAKIVLGEKGIEYSEASNSIKVINKDLAIPSNR